MSSILLTLIALLISNVLAKPALDKVKSWSIEPYLTPVPTRTQAAAILKDSLFLFGGQSSSTTGASSNREVFKLDLSKPPKKRAWESIANIDETLMTEPWFATNHGASTIDTDDDGIYITCEDSRIGHIWRFDTENDRYEFDVIATMQDKRNEGGINYKIEDCCSVSIKDTIYIIGGAQFAGRDPITNNAIFEDVDYVQIYNTTSDSWAYGTSLPLALQDTACESVNDEYIYIFGGSNDDNVKDDVYRYDVNNDIWNTYNGVLSRKRRMFGSVYVPNTDYVVLVGGDTGGQFSEEHEFLDLVEVFNINTNIIDQSVSLPSLNAGRSGAVTVIENKPKNKNKEENTIFIVGGEFDVDVGVLEDTEKLKFKVKL